MTSHPLRRAAGTWLPFAVLFVLSSCSKAGGGGRGGFQMPPMPVEVAPVASQRVRDQFRALGGVEADETVAIVSEVPGIVRSLPFKEGQPVARGALLAALDDREIRADAARAEAQRDQADANAARGVKLAHDELISNQQLEDVRTTLKVAEANVSGARARLDKTRIRAPFGGLVGRRRVSPGAYLHAGDTITELARVDVMRVNFAAPERYMGQLHVGMPVEITTPAFPDQVFEGKVQVVDPLVDAASRTVQLVARVPNPARRLKSGMSADVSVTFAERPSALVVPDEAVFAEGNQSFVFVVKADSTVTKTAIQIGTRDSMQVEIVRGLQAGQRVVKAGHQKLFEGAHVVPVQSSPGGPQAAR